MLHDDVNALDCRLTGITHEFHPSSSLPPSVPTTPRAENEDASSPDNNNTEPMRIRVRKELSIKEEVKQVLQLLTTYICKQDIARPNKPPTERTLLGKESMLLQVLIIIIIFILLL